MTPAQANAAVDEGVKAAKAAGLAAATVSLTRPGSVTLNILKAMRVRAGMPLTIHADTWSSNGKTADVRITFDPADSVKDLNLFASSTSSAANSLSAQLGRWFKNDLMVVRFEHKGEWGQRMEAAVKMDKKLNTSNLIAYSYDRENNTYAKLNTIVQKDDSGYIRFHTLVGGDIILSDGELINK